MPLSFKKLREEINNRHLIIFSIAVFAALVFWSSLALQNTFFQLISFVGKLIQANPNAGIGIFFILTALSAILSPFSSVPLVPVAIIIWGNFLTILLLWIGWSLGGAAAYIIGKKIAYPSLKKLIDIKKINYYSKRFSKKTSFWTVLLFRLSLPAEIPGYALGILKYNFWKYQLATALAELPFAIATVYASQALLSGQKTYFILWLGAGLLSMSAAFYYFHKKIIKET